MDRLHEEDILRSLEAHLANPSHIPWLLSPTRESADQTWALYGRLSPSTRRTLSAEILRNVLRSVTPKEHPPTTKATKLEINAESARQYERRLRNVIMDLSAAGVSALPQDFIVALRQLARTGDVDGTEQIYSQIIRSWPSILSDPVFAKSELLAIRTSAIAKWLRAVASTPVPDESRRSFRKDDSESSLQSVLVNKGPSVISALWSIVKEYSTAGITPDRNSLSLIMVSLNLSSEVFREKPFARHIDGVLEEIFKQAYGLDLPYLGIKDTAVDIPEGNEAGASMFNPVDHVALNALVEWYGRKGQVWNMVAAAEVFGDRPGMVYPELTREENELAANEAMSTTENEDRGPNTLDTQTPTMAPNEGILGGDGMSGERRGSPSSYGLRQMSNIDINNLLNTAANVVATFRFNRQSRSYGAFHPVPPSPSQITNLPPSSHNLKHDWGPVDNLTFTLMLRVATANRDLSAAMHILRTYLHAAAVQQTEWVHRALSNVKIARTDWTRQEAEMKEYKTVMTRWKEECTRRKLVRDELEEIGGEIPDDLKPPSEPDIQRPHIPWQPENWTSRLTPPSVLFSGYLIVPSMALARSMITSSNGAGARDALMELNILMSDTITRLHQEHVLLSGRQPTHMEMTQSSYVRAMAETPTDQVDNDAPFARHLLQIRDPEFVGAFDPVAYLYHVDTMFGKIGRMLERSLEQRQVFVERRRRQTAGDTVRRRERKKQAAKAAEMASMFPSLEGRGENGVQGNPGD